MNIKWQPYIIVNKNLTKKLQKVFDIYYISWKKTFKTILQWSCFVGHPVVFKYHSSEQMFDFSLYKIVTAAET